MQMIDTHGQRKVNFLDVGTDLAMTSSVSISSYPDIMQHQSVPQTCGHLVKAGRAYYKRIMYNLKDILVLGLPDYDYPELIRIDKLLYVSECDALFIRYHHLNVLYFERKVNAFAVSEVEDVGMLCISDLTNPGRRLVTLSLIQFL